LKLRLAKPQTFRAFLINIEKMRSFLELTDLHYFKQKVKLVTAIFQLYRGGWQPLKGGDASDDI